MPSWPNQKPFGPKNITEMVILGRKILGRNICWQHFGRHNCRSNVKLWEGSHTRCVYNLRRPLNFKHTYSAYEYACNGEELTSFRARSCHPMLCNTSVLPILAHTGLKNEYLGETINKTNLVFHVFPTLSHTKEVLHHFTGEISLRKHMITFAPWICPGNVPLDPLLLRSMSNRRVMSR